MGVGTNIKRLRRRLKLSQIELGKQLNVSGVFIHYLESDKRKPPVEMLKRLAEALETTTDELLKGVSNGKEGN